MADPGSRGWYILFFFKFSYFTRGINLMDIAHITWKVNIISDRIVDTRAETANSTEPIIIQIAPGIKAILDRYSKKKFYVFPIPEPGLLPLKKGIAPNQVQATQESVSPDSLVKTFMRGSTLCFQPMCPGESVNRMGFCGSAKNRFGFMG